MTVYRIAKSKYIEDLSGFGAYLAGGRWTLPGTYALYTAISRALSYLEFLVHQVDREVWPTDLKIATISIKKNDDILTLKPEDLPDEWKELIYHTSVQLTGTNLIRHGVLGIEVPSAIVSGERNLILNPSHSRFNKVVSIVQIEELRLDERFNRK